MIVSPHCPAQFEPGAVAAGRSHRGQGSTGTFLRCKRKPTPPKERQQYFLSVVQRSLEQVPIMTNIHLKNERCSSANSVARQTADRL
jgi:hypothetical protein